MTFPVLLGRAPTAGAGTETSVELDLALLAFLKCHITSPLKWDALRLMLEREGRWVGVDDLAQVLHRQPGDVARGMSELAQEGVLEEWRAAEGDVVRYRLPAADPSTLVLKRLVETSKRSLELRAIIAAHLSHVQHAPAA